MPSQEPRKPLILPEDVYREGARRFGTPLHLYSETHIRARCRAFHKAFSWRHGDNPLNFYAAKANPNPDVLQLMRLEGFGIDCSSMTELVYADVLGFEPGKIMFTSNQTSLAEYKRAIKMKAYINLDDISHIAFLKERLPEMPKFLSFRYNPGPERDGNQIIGKPEESKFGVAKHQIIDAYREAQAAGVKEFGLHTMICSNCMDVSEHIATAKMLFELAVRVYHETGARIKFVNFGGGIGIPYLPGQKDIDVDALSAGVQKLYNEIVVPGGLHPLGIAYECGRLFTGSCGDLVMRVVGMKNTYKKYIGVDACSAHLARPAIYGAYHHISHLPEETLPPKIAEQLPSRRTLFEDCTDEIKDGKLTFDVVGSLCENSDKFAIDRQLPASIKIGDLLVIHDTGAHGHSMGSNYNGKLRSPEVVWQGRTPWDPFYLTRRRETVNDLFRQLVEYDMAYWE